MGAWGAGPFENDMALDWFAELEEETSFSELTRKIEDVVTDDYLEANLVQEAVASIAILAAIMANNKRLLPDFETSSLDKLREIFLPKIDDNMMDLVEDALGIIKRSDDNELYDHWMESDDFEDWIAHIDYLGEIVL